MMEERRIDPTQGQTGQSTDPVKLYEFRKLTAGDIMPMVRIIRKVGLQKIMEILEPELPNLVDMEGETEEEIGKALGMDLVFDLINIILDNLEHCEKDLFKLLGNVSDLGDEGVRKLPLDIFGEMLVDFVNKEEFPNFFKAVSRFVK